MLGNVAISLLAPAQAAGKSFLWKVTGKGGTVYVAIVGPPTLQAPEVVGELSLSGSRNMIRSQSVAHTVGLLCVAIAEAMAARAGSVE